jgi:hypothetical protein
MPTPPESAHKNSKFTEVVGNIAAALHKSTPDCSLFFLQSRVLFPVPFFGFNFALFEKIRFKNPVCAVRMLSKQPEPGG